MDKGRYALTTSAEMAALKPCETIFRSLIERLARINSFVAPGGSSKHIHTIGIEKLIQTTPNSVIRGFVRPLKHYINVWIARASASHSSHVLLSSRSAKDMFVNIGFNRREAIGLH